MKLSALINTICACVTFIVLLPFFLIFVFPIIFLPASWRYRSRWYYGAGHWCARIFLRAAGITFHIEGKEKLGLLAITPAVIILSHQSILDPFIIELLLRSRPRIVFSNDYSSMPLLGIILRRMHVIVQRASARGSNAALDSAITLARAHGNHVVLFPEGTRHSDGQVHKFYRGFTVLAEQLHRPVVPVFISGMHKIFPRGARLINPIGKPVQIHIGDLFVFDPHSQTREEFLEKVHNWFILESGRVNTNH